MVSTDESLETSVNMLNSLCKGMKNGQNLLSSFMRRQAMDKASSIPRAVDMSTQVAAWPPTLEELIDHSSGFQPNTMILGISEDGLPLTLDLTNPSPGALLVTGDRGGGKSALLSSALASVCLLNTQQQVVIHILAKETEIYQQLTVSNHCKDLSAFDKSKNSTLINELADVVEWRRRNRPEDPCIILVIDDLPTCLEALNPRDFGRLCWLIRHGPRSFVWTIASLSAEDSPHVDPKILSAFRTRLIGHIHIDDYAAYLSQDAELDARWIEEGLQYYVRHGDDWLSFWVCFPEKSPNPQEGLIIRNVPKTGTKDLSSPIHEQQSVKELIAWNDRLAGAALRSKPDTDVEGEAPSGVGDIVSEYSGLQAQTAESEALLLANGDNLGGSYKLDSAIPGSDARTQQVLSDERQIPGEDKKPNSLKAIKQKSAFDRNWANVQELPVLIEGGFNPDEDNELEMEDEQDISALTTSKPAVSMFEVIDSIISRPHDDLVVAGTSGKDLEDHPVDDVLEDESLEYEYVDENENYPFITGDDLVNFQMGEHRGEDTYSDED